MFKGKQLMGNLSVKTDAVSLRQLIINLPLFYNLYFDVSSLSKMLLNSENEEENCAGKTKLMMLR